MKEFEACPRGGFISTSILCIQHRKCKSSRHFQAYMNDPGISLTLLLYQKPKSSNENLINLVSGLWKVDLKGGSIKLKEIIRSSRTDT